MLDINLLYGAFKKNDLKAIKRLLHQHPKDINKPLHPYRLVNLIACAAEDGKLPIIQYLLETYGYGDTTNSIDYSGVNNILLNATQCSDEQQRKIILQYLYDNFNRLSFTDGTKKSHIAAALDNKQYFSANLNALKEVSDIGITPKFYAVVTQSKNVLALYDNNNDFKDIPIIDKIIISGENQTALANSQFNLALAYKSNEGTEEFRKYLDAFVKSMAKVTNVSQHDRRLPVAEICLAKYYLNKMQLDKSAEHYDKAIALLEKIENKNDLDWRRFIHAHFELGTFCYNELKFDSAIEHFKKIIEYDSKINQKAPDDWRLLSKILFNLAAIHQKQNNYLKAMEFCAELRSLLPITFQYYDDIKFKLFQLYQLEGSLYIQGALMENILHWACTIFNDEQENPDTSLHTFNQLYAKVIQEGKTNHYIALLQTIEMAQILKEKEELPHHNFFIYLIEPSDINEKKQRLKQNSVTLTNLTSNHTSVILALNYKIAELRCEIAAINTKLCKHNTEPENPIEKSSSQLLITHFFGQKTTDVSRKRTLAENDKEESKSKRINA